MMGTVALTGATGFIGKHIVEQLLARGYSVRLLTRTAQRKSLRKLAWIHGSLENAHALGELVRGADAVVHCAGQVRGHNQQTFLHSNVTGSLRLLSAAKASESCRRFLFISSLAARHPELSWYAHSKYVAETQLLEQAGSISLGIFRPTAVYGPGDKELHSLFEWLLRGFLPQLGSPESQLSFLHVYDLAQAVSQWLLADDVGSPPFELCDGHLGGYSWERLQQIGSSIRQKPVRLVGIPLPLLRLIASCGTTINRLARKEPMLTHSKIGELTHLDWSASNQSISERIAWKPSIQLEKALREGLF